MDALAQTQGNAIPTPLARILSDGRAFDHGHGAGRPLLSVPAAWLLKVQTGAACPRGCVPDAKAGTAARMPRSILRRLPMGAAETPSDGRARAVGSASGPKVGRNAPYPYRPRRAFSVRRMQSVRSDGAARCRSMILPSWGQNRHGIVRGTAMRASPLGKAAIGQSIPAAR